MTRHKHIRILLSSLLLFIFLSGCFGLAHIGESVPALKIEGQLQCSSKNKTNKLKIVVPDFYGEPDAFISFIEEDKDEMKPYKKNTAVPDTSGLFSSKFSGEERYIGAMFPFMPSEKTRRYRLIFIKSTESNLMYRINLTGTNTEIYSTDINVAKSLYDQTEIKNKTPEEKNDVEVIRLILDFYSNIAWESTDDLVISDVIRTQDLDKINLIIKTKNCS